jgi:transcriptional regulator with XRE-family HTH domain
MTIGARIKQARERKSWSQQDLADALKPRVSRAAVSQWEVGKTTPGTTRLQEIAEKLGARFPWLSNAEGAMTPDAGEPPAIESEATAFGLQMRRLALSRLPGLSEIAADDFAQGAADFWVKARGGKPS